jgi:hypothetical protein
MGGMFGTVSRAPGTLVHKGVGEPGRAARVGFDGSRHTRCGKVLPVLGSAEREALDPPEDSALRWREVTCPACLALKFTRQPLSPAPEDTAYCACGHGPEHHFSALGGRCARCIDLAAEGRCNREHLTPDGPGAVAAPRAE